MPDRYQSTEGRHINSFNPKNLLGDCHLLKDAGLDAEQAEANYRREIKALNFDSIRQSNFSVG